MWMALDAFWRAFAYSLHPRLIAVSLLPLLLLVLVGVALAYLYWDAAIAAMQAWLEQWALVTFALAWLESVGLGALQGVLAPLIVLLLATPALVLLTLLLVALLVTPIAVQVVARRRFATLERRHGGSWWLGLGWALAHSVLALLALLITLPLWLVPPLALLLPPLILGWLTYRVLAFDALSEHASRAERHELLRRHRGVLLLMGLLTGFLGTAPSLLWASGAMFIAMVPLLLPLAVWIYTWIFALASLWFVHFMLAALQALRAEALTLQADAVHERPTAQPENQAAPALDSAHVPPAAAPALPGPPTASPPPDRA